MRTQKAMQLPIIAIVLACAGSARQFPVLFEPQDAGQYRVRGNGYAITIAPNGMALATVAGTAKLQWLGTAGGELSPAEALPARINTMTGDRRTWRTGVPAFGRLRSSGLYRGIDLVYYGTDRQLEYDFLVHPGADPRVIGFQLTAKLNAAGELQLPNGLRWQKPVAHQDGRPIPARFRQISKGKFGIALGAYDRSRELVIDPVLTYATYLGGSLGDEARGIAADAAGNTYIVGSTVSIDFPSTTRGQTFGGQDVFVAKLNPSGRALEWAAYIGGSGSDTGAGIAIDAAGAVYITGQTASTNFPVTPNAPQPVLAGGSAVTDAFAVKLAPNGQTLVYATYLGGTLSDNGNAIFVDNTGAAFVAGRTDSTDFPSTTRDVLPPRGAGDAFVAKLSTDGSTFVYASILGGFALDSANSVVVDLSGAAIVTGETRSENFPVTEVAYQKERRGNSDAFIAKLAPNGASLLFSTYLGGDGQEAGRAVAIDRFGSVYAAGSTGSPNLPVSFNGAQRAASLLPDAFVAKLDSTGSSLVYGTYLGGDAEDQANAITVDASGSAYVAGQTISANFPVINDGPLAAEGPKGGFDGFVTRVSSGGNFLQFSTLFGGSGTDAILGLANDGRGRIWVAGTTDSTNLPASTGALAARAPGVTDGFVALLSEISVAVAPAAATLGARESQQFTVSVSNAANTAVRWSIFPDLGTISQAGLYTAPAAVSGSTVVTVSAISVADGTKIGQASVTLVNRVSVVVEPATVSLLPGRTQQFTAIVSGTANTAVTWSITPAIGSISAAGVYSAPANFLNEAPVTVRATSVAETSRFATATVNLTLPPAAPAPLIVAEGITNAASFRAAATDGGIAPGEMITIFGANLGPAVPVASQVDARGFVTTRLGGTRVLFDGTPGAMIVASSGQVSAVVPYGIEGLRSTAVSVEFEGRASAQIPISVTAAVPAIFTQNSSGSGLASISRQNGQLVTAANPATGGDVLTFFATGEGATNPAGVDGKPAAAPLPLPLSPVKILVDGLEAELLYAGGAPGQVAGVMQVNFVMPGGGIGQLRRIQLQVGDRISPDTVTVPTR